MKLRHALAIAAATFLASTLNVALAAPLNKGLNEVLPKVYLDEEILERHAGTVLVDLKNKILFLNVYEDPCNTMTAPPDMNTCLASPLRVEQIKVPLATVETDCGSKIYRGAKDESGRGGLYREVEVIDHSTRTCKDSTRGILEVNAAVVNVRAHETKTYLLLK